MISQRAQGFWNNPFIYGMFLILFGLMIGFLGDKIVYSDMMKDIGTVLSLLGVGLLGFKGVMLVIMSMNPAGRSTPAPQVKEISMSAPALLSVEPSSVTENTTRQLDSSVEIGIQKPRDTQPTS